MPQLLRSSEIPTAVLLTVVFFVLGVWHARDPVTSFDSVRYANVGRWIADGRGVSASVTVVPVQEGTADRGDGLRAFSIQPPGLPLIYALAGEGRLAGLHRVLNTACLVLLGWLVWRLGLKLSGDATAAGLAAVLTAAAPVVLESTANMWTDLPFAVLATGAVWCVVRSSDGPRPVAWLAAGAGLAGLATLFRYPGLGLGLLFVVDAGFAWRRSGRRVALTRLAVGLGIFAVLVVPLLARNVAVAGSWTGTVPRPWPEAPAVDVGRGWAFLGTRLMQVFVPGFFSRAANDFLVTANRVPDGWWVPRAVGGILLAGAVAWGTVRRRRGLPLLARGPAALLAATGGYLLIIFAGAARHEEIHVIEFRYALPAAPVLFLGVGTLVARALPARPARAMALVLGAAFLAGALVLPRPRAADHGFLAGGLDWIEAHVPVETAILTNGGKVLLEENLARRIHHLSVWHHRHLLPAEYRSEAGFTRFLGERDIEYIVLIGPPDIRKVQYWGRHVTSLFTGRVWRDRIVFRDENMVILHVPPDATRSRGGSP